MRHRLPLFVATAALALTCGSVVLFACPDKTSSTSAAAVSHSGACTAQMAASCTAAQAAACKAKSASAAAYTASASRCVGFVGIVPTSAAGHCSMKNGAAGVTASNEAMDHCAAHGAMTKGAAAQCPAMNGASATDAVMGGNSACTGHGAAMSSTKLTQAMCDACTDMKACQAELEAVGGQTQIVLLKNGVMFVYTGQGANRVRAVQAAMVRRNEKLQALTAAGDKAHLCGECKSMRGAAASGKLNREMVTIEDGCLTLLTSNDPSIVAKLHALVGAENSARTKS